MRSRIRSPLLKINLLFGPGMLFAFPLFTCRRPPHVADGSNVFINLLMKFSIRSHGLLTMLVYGRTTILERWRMWQFIKTKKANASRRMDADYAKMHLLTRKKQIMVILSIFSFFH
jgi:hypothetical protein